MKMWRPPLKFYDERDILDRRPGGVLRAAQPELYKPSGDGSQHEAGRDPESAEATTSGDIPGDHHHGHSPEHVGERNRSRQGPGRPSQIPRTRPEKPIVELSESAQQPTGLAILVGRESTGHECDSLACRPSRRCRVS